MDQKTKGAWLVHHADKLQSVSSSSEFEQIDAAGKCGKLLSGLAASDDVTLGMDKVKALAKGLNINTKLELPELLKTLRTHHLISENDNKTIQVLGLTADAVLKHTADIFDGLGASSTENAALEFSEQVSKCPIKDNTAAQYLGDTFKLSKSQTKDLIQQAEGCGFIDAETIDSSTKLYFNGNLFKRETAQKTKKVLDSLSSEEIRKLQSIEQQLTTAGCLEETTVKQTLGESLYGKLTAIGMFDINEVSNDSSKTRFITRPAAFNKYGDSLVEDAFDLAKAFVASLTFGMTKSDNTRGKITMINALMRKLISGAWVGPAPAIGQDYRILEYNRVVEIRQDSGGRYSMRLLKKEVGEIALKVISQGDASEHSLPHLPQVALTDYLGPEANRRVIRKSQITRSKKESADILLSLRTGGQL